ncbi:nucleotidyltransferase family protein [Williamsia muralis]|uniref:RelA/SpoT domain-containing protein n=1 Tax=Williamsia marianensis TaxID=85044 RepID=A0ABU4ETE0_WILMA|nr:hypothetical protein [Williamsia muralis]MDV7134518.1 hypothetical protein [Williamsia muralis]
MASTPAAIHQAYGEISPHLDALQQHIEALLPSVLSELAPIAIIGRKKTAESIYQKLQTGRYRRFSELDDLLGFTVVLRTRTEMLEAKTLLAQSELQTLEDRTSDDMAPTDFRYQEPKLVVKPSVTYLDRHPELELSIEIQFTTALQHALDKATHDFDYKGQDYSWSKFRVVAQLRAMLELADTMIDDMERGTNPLQERVSVNSGFRRQQEILAVLQSNFEESSFPKDVKRAVDTVGSWCRSISITGPDLDAILKENVPKQSGGESVALVERVLSSLVETHLTELLKNYSGLFVVSSESRTFLPNLSRIPGDRLVEFA